MFTFGSRDQGSSGTIFAILLTFCRRFKADKRRQSNLLIYDAGRISTNGLDGGVLLCGAGAAGTCQVNCI